MNMQYIKHDAELLKSIEGIEKDTKDIQEELTRMYKLQADCAQTEVLKHLTKLDAYLFKNVQFFTKRKWTSKLFSWYFKKKVIFVSHKRDLGYTPPLPGLALFAGVQVYGKFHELKDMPIYSTKEKHEKSLTALAKRSDYGYNQHIERLKNMDPIK